MSDWRAVTPFEQEQVALGQAFGTYALRELKALCDRLGLPLFLDAGTLLGAFREGGWIPWDDDVDVLMHRRDFLSLAVHAQDLPADLALRDPRDGESLSVVPRIVLVRSEVELVDRFGIRIPECQKVALDIFLLDPGPQSAAVAIIWVKILHIVRMMLALRGTSLIGIGKAREGLRPSVAASGLRAVSLCLPASVLRSVHWRIASVFHRKTSGSVLYCLGHSSRQFSNALPREWFASDTILFEGEEYLAPRPEPYLRLHYGATFHEPPPQHQRRPHRWARFCAELNGQRWSLTAGPFRP